MKPVASKIRTTQKRAFNSRSIREVKRISDFEPRTGLKLGLAKEQVLSKAKMILGQVNKFDHAKTIVIFPLSKQGGNFYFAQGLLKVLAPKVRVVSLLTTGLKEHEKVITNQLKNLVRGRTNAIVFDDLHMGNTQSNIRSALAQNGIARENVSYNEFIANKLGSKMAAFIERKNSSKSSGVQLLQLSDANLIRLMYMNMIGGRKGAEYSEWKAVGKLDVNIFEHVLDKMHSNGLVTQKVLNRAGLKQLDGIGKFDPYYLVDSKTQKQMPQNEVLKKVFSAIPKSEIDLLVKRNERELAIQKRAEYVKGIAAAREIIAEKKSI